MKKTTNLPVSEQAITASKIQTLVAPSDPAIDLPPAPSISAPDSAFTDNASVSGVTIAPNDRGGTTQVSTGDLGIHPLNAHVYGAEPIDSELVESVRTRGILTPLGVSPDLVVLSGHRRLAAAKEAGLEFVPVVFTAAHADELAQQEHFLEANRQRVKSTDQRLREYEVYLKIETARAALRRGRRSDIVANSAPCSPEVGCGKARDIAARKVGMAGSTAEKGMRVINEIERLIATGDVDRADALRRQLNETSIDATHRECVPVRTTASRKVTRAPEQAASVKDRTDVRFDARGARGPFEDEKAKLVAPESNDRRLPPEGLSSDAPAREEAGVRLPTPTQPGDGPCVRPRGPMDEPAAEQTAITASLTFDECCPDIAPSQAANGAHTTATIDDPEIEISPANVQAVLTRVQSMSKRPPCSAERVLRRQRMTLLVAESVNRETADSPQSTGRECLADLRAVLAALENVMQWM